MFPQGDLSDGCGLVSSSGGEWVLLAQGGQCPAGSRRCGRRKENGGNVQRTAGPVLRRGRDEPPAESVKAAFSSEC